MSKEKSPTPQSIKRLRNITVPFTVGDLEDLLEIIGDLSNCLSEEYRFPKNNNWHVPSEIKAAIKIHKKYNNIVLSHLPKKEE